MHDDGDYGVGGAMYVSNRTFTSRGCVPGGLRGWYCSISSIACCRTMGALLRMLVARCPVPERP